MVSRGDMIEQLANLEFRPSFPVDKAPHKMFGKIITTPKVTAVEKCLDFNDNVSKHGSGIKNNTIDHSTQTDRSTELPSERCQGTSVCPTQECAGSVSQYSCTTLTTFPDMATSVPYQIVEAGSYYPSYSFPLQQPISHPPGFPEYFPTGSVMPHLPVCPVVTSIPVYSRGNYMSQQYHAYPAPPPGFHGDPSQVQVHLSSVTSQSSQNPSCAAKPRSQTGSLQQPQRLPEHTVPTIVNKQTQLENLRSIPLPVGPAPQKSVKNLPSRKLKNIPESIESPSPGKDQEYILEMPELVRYNYPAPKVSEQEELKFSNTKTDEMTKNYTKAVSSEGDTKVSTPVKPRKIKLYTANRNAEEKKVDTLFEERNKTVAEKVNVIGSTEILPVKSMVVNDKEHFAERQDEVAEASWDNEKQETTSLTAGKEHIKFKMSDIAETTHRGGQVFIKAVNDLKSSISCDQATKRNRSPTPLRRPRFCTSASTVASKETTAPKSYTDWKCVKIKQEPRDDYHDNHSSMTEPLSQPASNQLGDTVNTECGNSIVTPILNVKKKEDLTDIQVTKVKAENDSSLESQTTEVKAEHESQITNFNVELKDNTSTDADSSKPDLLNFSHIKAPVLTDEVRKPKPTERNGDPSNPQTNWCTGFLEKGSVEKEKPDKPNEKISEQMNMEMKSSPVNTLEIADTNVSESFKVHQLGSEFGNRSDTVRITEEESWDTDVVDSVTCDENKNNFEIGKAALIDTPDSGVASVGASGDCNTEMLPSTVKDQEQLEKAVDEDKKTAKRFTKTAHNVVKDYLGKCLFFW